MEETIFDFELEDMATNNELFEEAAYLLRALAHETRLRAVMYLAKTGEMSVSELQDKTGCEQSLLSHHLTDMRAKGILSCRRSGKNNFYSIKDKRVLNVLRCMLNCGSDPLKGKPESLN